MNQFQMVCGDCVKLEGETDTKVIAAFYVAVEKMAKQLNMNEIMAARKVRQIEELRKYLFEVARKVA